MSESKVTYIQSMLLKKQQEMYSNVKTFQQFMAFIPSVVDFSYEEQLQLFMLAENETVFYTVDEWRSVGRIVTPGERAYTIYNFETQSFVEFYGLSQTQGVAFLPTPPSKRVQESVRAESLQLPLERHTPVIADNTYRKKLNDFFVNRFTGKKDDTIELPKTPPTRSQLEVIELGDAISSMAKAVFRKVKEVFTSQISKIKKVRGLLNEKDRTSRNDYTRNVTSMVRDGSQSQTKEMGEHGGNDGLRESSIGVGRLLDESSYQGLGRVGDTTYSPNLESMGRESVGLSERRENDVVSDVTSQGQVDGLAVRSIEESPRIAEDDADRLDERTYERVDNDSRDNTDTISDLNRISETIDKVTPKGTVQTQAVPFSFDTTEEKAKATRLYHLLQMVCNGYVPDDAINGTYVIATSVNDTIHVSKDGAYTRIERALVYDDMFSDVVESGTFYIDDFEQVAVPTNYQDVINGVVDTDKLYNTSLDWIEALSKDVEPYPLEKETSNIYPIYRIVEQSEQNATIVVFSSQSQEEIVAYYKTLNHDDSTYDLVYHASEDAARLVISKNYVIDKQILTHADGLKEMPHLTYGTEFIVDGTTLYVDSYNIEKNFVYLGQENGGFFVKKYALTDILHHYPLASEYVNEMTHVQEKTPEIEAILDETVSQEVENTTIVTFDEKTVDDSLENNSINSVDDLKSVIHDNLNITTYNDEEIIIPKQNTTIVAFDDEELSKELENTTIVAFDTPKLEVSMEFTESPELSQHFEADTLYDYETFSKTLMTLNVKDLYKENIGYYKTYVDIFIDGRKLTAVRYDIASESKGLLNCIGSLSSLSHDFDAAYLEHCGNVMQAIDDKLYDEIMMLQRDNLVERVFYERLNVTENENTTIVVFDEPSEEVKRQPIQEIEQYELLDEQMNVVSYSDNLVDYTTLPLSIRLLAGQLKNEIEQNGKYQLSKYQDTAFYNDLIDYIDTHITINVDETPFVLKRSNDDVQLSVRFLSDTSKDTMLDDIQNYVLHELNQIRNEEQIEYDLKTLIAKYHEVNSYVQDELMHKIVELQLDENVIDKVLTQDIKPVVDNTVIFQPDFTYANGKKAKFENNILAIEIVQRLDEQQRQATEQEKVILQQYAGWGGLSEAFDATNESWKEEYIRLKELLPKDQYQSAKSSMLTAYYTDTRLINAMYKGLQSIPGFKPQNILDPATATGNFIGMLPNKWQDANINAVEIDSLSVGIAKYLYGNDKTTVSHRGFEQTQFKPGTFDLVVGNVPFNDISVMDTQQLLGTRSPLVHDYFFAKSIDLMADNGIMAFITSSGTLDKKDDSLRRYMSERGELLGAFRLPNNAFSQSAHTSVVSDVIIFKKTANPTPNPNWLSVSSHPRFNEISINDYFIEHPEHVLGDIAVKNFRGKTLDVKAAMSFEQLTDMLSFRLSEVLSQEQTYIIERENTTIVAFDDEKTVQEMENTTNVVFDNAQESTLNEQENTTNVVIDENNLSLNEILSKFDMTPKPYSYFMRDDTVFYMDNETAIEQTLPGKTTQRVKGMIAIRTLVDSIIQLQLHDYNPSDLETLQQALNDTYDKFVKEHGYLNEPANSRAFSDDSKSALLLSIEKVRQNDLGVSYEKSDIFEKATIRPIQTIDRADSPEHALQLSLVKKGVVDFDYMMSLLDNTTPEALVEQLYGKIFLDIEYYEQTGNYWRSFDSAEEYLSGNVVSKLRYNQNYLVREDAAEELKQLVEKHHISALEKVQPEWISHVDIGFQLGSRWIPKEYLKQFIFETLGTPTQVQRYMRLSYNSYDGQYTFESNGYDRFNPAVTSEYGTDRMNAYKIFEKAINMQDVIIYDRKTDSEGNERSEINPEATLLAREKKTLLEQAFDNWLFNDPERVQELETIYNNQFNTYVSRQYDGSELSFDGMNNQYELRPHQRNVVARILYERTALMAHEVGAGKTAAMITAGKYLKDAGMIHKPLYVVPNALKVQWAKEYYEFYPNANVLLVTEKDFAKANRKAFLSRIATGNYDAIVMGESQFTMISLSEDKQRAFFNEEIERLEEALELARNSDESNLTVKRIQQQLHRHKQKLEQLSVKGNTEDILTFEELGVDFLFIDEAHRFKNLGVSTRLSNVAGVATTASQKAVDMLMKVRYIQSLNDGGGIVFATGTPISNSMTEMFTLQRYLQPEVLEQAGVEIFDNWVGTFGKVESNLEINPEGEGYRIRQRLKKFNNLPELLAPFRQIADIVTSDMMDIEKPTLATGQVQTIVSEKSDYQEEMMLEFSERATKIRNRQVDPSEDNMLKVTNDGKLLAIDPRLIDSTIPRDENSKISKAAKNIFEIWEKTTEDKLAQIVFSDSGVPKPNAFNVYDELKTQLVEKGIPEDEIAFVHSAKTDKQRDALFEKVRNGTVRVIIGSTDKLGTGANVQTRLIAAHHIDCPWKPSDITQRDGRIVRQGNINKEVSIFRYITKGTFDSYLWQIQEQKLTYINQVMTGRSLARSGDDLDETVLNAAEVKALATGNPHIARKMEIDNTVMRLQLLKKQHAQTQERIRKNIAEYPDKLAIEQAQLEKIIQDNNLIMQYPLDKLDDGFVITINGVTYTNDTRKEFNDALQNIYKELPMTTERVSIGSFRGFEVLASRTTTLESLKELDSIKVMLKGARYYTVVLSENTNVLVKLNNALNRIPKELEDKQDKINQMTMTYDKEKELVVDAFPQEQELKDLLIEQSRLTTIIEMATLQRANRQHEQSEEIVIEDVEEELTPNTTIVAFDTPTTDSNNTPTIQVKDINANILTLDVSSLGFNRSILSTQDIQDAFISQNFVQSFEQLYDKQYEKIMALGQDSQYAKDMPLFYQQHMQNIQSAVDNLGTDVDDRVALTKGKYTLIVKRFNDGFMVSARTFNQQTQQTETDRQTYYASSRLLAYDMRHMFMLDKKTLDEVVQHVDKANYLANTRLEKQLGVLLDTAVDARERASWHVAVQKGNVSTLIDNIPNLRSRRLQDLEAFGIPGSEYIDSSVEGYKIWAIDNNRSGESIISSVRTQSGEMYHFSANEDGSVQLVNDIDSADVIVFENEEALYRHVITDGSHILTKSMEQRLEQEQQQQQTHIQRIPDEPLLQQDKQLDREI